jgi:hypothetical protein
VFERGPSLVGAAALNGLRMVVFSWLFQFGVLLEKIGTRYVVHTTALSIPQPIERITIKP